MLPVVLLAVVCLVFIITLNYLPFVDLSSLPVLV